MWQILIFFTFLVARSQQQNFTCATSPMPALNGGCPPGTTLIPADDGCCIDSDLVPVTTPPPTTVAPTTFSPSGSPSTSCLDLVNSATGQSDCPRMASYCTNAIYRDLMKTQCPKTCGYCSDSGVVTTPSSTPCVDLANSATGQSDCPRLASYCTNSIYRELMKTQCPKTCGYCSGSGTITTPSSTPCVDLVNSATGQSDCGRMASYCNNALYVELMKKQCPRTCGYC